MPTNTFNQDVSKAGGSVIPTEPVQNVGNNVGSFTQAPATPTQPVDISTLSGATPFKLPSAPVTPNYDISSLPSISALLNPAPTSAQDKQSQLETQLEGDTAKLGTQTAAQTTAEDAAARSLGATNGLSDFNTQLTDINNQIQSLQKESQAIPLQLQQAATGRGVTADALNTQQTGLLRQNSIKALGLSAVAQTLQGNIASAQQTASRAVDLQFAPVQAEIDYLKQAIADNQDNLSREDKQRSDELQVQLQERQRVLDQQKDDRSTAIAMAAAAIKNYPNDPGAQYAARQALEAPDLQTAFSLVGKYQAEPVQQTIAGALGSASNDPSTLDPNSQSILAQTGLSVPAFNYLTQGTSALSRLSAADRQAVFDEAQKYLNKNGIDLSTFQSQYQAYTDVLQKNIARANQTSTFAGEVTGTVDQFVQDIGNDFGNIKAANVANLFAKGQTNDPTVQRYAFDLQTMQNDLAGYYAASRGASSPDDADLRAAASVITNGINANSALAFKQAIAANEAKVTNVVNQSVDTAHKQVWSLFGVGDKYQSAAPSSADTVIVVGPDGQQYSLPKAQLADAFKQGYTLPAAPMDHI